MRLFNIVVHTLLAALILGAWAVAPASTSQVAAQTTEDDEERYRARFSRIDLDGSNAMTRGEYTIYRVATFNGMDDNADGTLSLPEFRDRGRKPSERRAAPRGGRKHSSVSIRAAVAGWDVKSGTAIPIADL